jgi:hypothetical protein
MATVKVVEIIQRVQVILQDTTFVRWPALELQLWINDSYREIVNLKPDVNTQTGTFTCAVGPRQVLTTSFANAIRLIDIIRNVASASTKQAVRLVDRNILDDQRKGWYNETTSINIDHYMFDARLPKEFMVYPPATNTAQLEVVYSQVPAAHTLTEAQLINPATTEVIRIDDSYSNAMLDYVLYRAYSKDADYAANAQRAVAHYQAFQNAISGKITTEAASRPGVA